MRLQKVLLLLPALMLCLVAVPSASRGQATTGKTYQQMSPAERSAFVAEQAKRIARDMSGSEYEFTPDFITDIQQSVNQYSRRISDNGSVSLGKRDLRLVVERGHAEAPLLIAAFKARNLSSLMGLYIPWIESEYLNIKSPNSIGAIGMFQFLPKTGARFGLSPADLLNVAKSADAAALYISDGLKQFDDDPMKEAL